MELANSKYFDEVEVNKLKTEPDCTDEYVTTVNIDFFFKQEEIKEVKIFGSTLQIIGVNMNNNTEYYDEDVVLCYTYKANPDGDRRMMGNIDVNPGIIQDIFNIICEEEAKGKRGWLKNHTFSEDEIFEDCIPEDKEDE